MLQNWPKIYWKRYAGLKILGVQMSVKFNGYFIESFSVPDYACIWCFSEENSYGLMANITLKYNSGVNALYNLEFKLSEFGGIRHHSHIGEHRG